MRSSLSRFTKILIPKNSSSSSSQEIMDHEGTKQQLMQWTCLQSTEFQILLMFLKNFGSHTFLYH